MPIIWSERDFIFIIHTNDHNPFHIYAYKSDGVALVNSRDGSISGYLKMTETEAKVAAQITANQRALFLQKGQEIHGAANVEIVTGEFDFEPRASCANLNRENGCIHLELQNGITMMIPVSTIQKLENASGTDIEAMRLLGDGFALYWPTLDADAIVPQLTEGISGAKHWMQQMAVRFLPEI